MDRKMNIYCEMQYRLLRFLYPRSPDLLTETPGESKLYLLGKKFLENIHGNVIIDFGCGKGTEAVAMAKLGAKLVIGVDIQESHLSEARELAEAAGVQDRCIFSTSTTELADVVVSVDAFEHFDKPDQILSTMHNLLKPGGYALVSFGPTWYHPLGGHLFSIFPWAHLVLNEKALVAWRGAFKSDGATCFGEVAGGLNQITIQKFTKMANRSDFQVTNLEKVPIRKLRFVHNRVTQEFTTALVRGELLKRDTNRSTV